MALHELSLKAAARKQRESKPAVERIASTLDDIARALELIAIELQSRR